MSKNQSKINVETAENENGQKPITNIAPELTLKRIRKMDASTFKKHLKNHSINVFDTYTRTDPNTATLVKDINLFHLFSEGTSAKNKTKRGHLLNHLIKNYPEPDIANLINGCDSLGRTPLHYASTYFLNMHTLTFLVNNGANIHAADIHGNQPIHFAASRILTDNIQKLHQLGADINATNAEGKTPLHLIVKCSPKHQNLTRNATELLVKNITYIRNHGGSPNVKDVFGKTALHYAASNHPDIAAILYESFTPGLGKTQYTLKGIGITWEHKHAPNGYEAINSTIKDSEKKLALDYLPKSAQSDILRKRLKVDKNYRLSYNPAKGQTMFHGFARSFDPQAFNSNAVKIKHILKTIPSDLNAKDLNGNTGLHYLVQRAESIPNLADFIKKDLDINAVNNDGLTALHLAASHGHVKAVQQLIKAGANHELLDKSGKTFEAYLDQSQINQDEKGPSKKGFRSRIQEQRLNEKQVSPDLP
ncbi:MAG: ankyrin repeat domain-containing protein [Alphaproteobacteria bacterium]|nr:ankyrin repeat domain-containing protein [Alphaproteobacteria bacterium]